jgi:hypothetical protein
MAGNIHHTPPKVTFNLYSSELQFMMITKYQMCSELTDCETQTSEEKDKCNEEKAVRAVNPNFNDDPGSFWDDEQARVGTLLFSLQNSLTLLIS